MNHQFKKYSILGARYALSAAYLSAIADRLGWWGEPGTPNVTWGSIDNYNKFVAILNPWASEPLVPVVGWTATSLEAIFAGCFITGYKVRPAAIGSAGLLASFAIAMAYNLGVQSQLNYSVPSAAACSLLIAATQHQDTYDDLKRNVDVTQNHVAKSEVRSRVFGNSERKFSTFSNVITRSSSLPRVWAQRNKAGIILNAGIVSSELVRRQCCGK